MPTAFKPADIILPYHATVDYEKWAVIACDQYTSEPEYWESVTKFVGQKKSTLNMILPEIYLESENVRERISILHAAIKEFVNAKQYTKYENSMIYVERTQTNGKLRQGIIGMIDLEEYNFNKGSKSSVRATEATVVERIPPRLKVRETAMLEIPHIMILIDDKDKTVIEEIGKRKESFEKLYDFDLMKNSGNIKGFLVDDKSINDINISLTQLGDNKAFRERYNVNDENTLLFAMGDGNHSLATAKAFYENLKKQNPNIDLSNHPARYALVEMVNLHSEALEFEAIHRIVRDVDSEKLLTEMTKKLGITNTPTDQYFSYVVKGKETKVYIENKTSNLSVGTVQKFLDEYLKENDGKIDYIHGIESLKKLTKERSSIGFILPDMKKEDLFPTVIKDGALPRKTFSMGHADDKRFYIESRRIS